MKESTLVIASGNIKKRKEIEELLGEIPCTVLTLKDFPDCPEVEETGSTFMENATLKAITIAAYTGFLTLADDSGLEVDALDGLPGVHSARFASVDQSQNASDEDNTRLLLEKLERVPDEKRNARFVCAITLAESTGNQSAQKIADASGTVEGRIAHEPRGSEGFGYDPVFLIPEYNQTFAELGAAVKHRISHRANALKKILPELLKQLK